MATQRRAEPEVLRESQRPTVQVDQRQFGCIGRNEQAHPEARLTLEGKQGFVGSKQMAAAAGNRQRQTE